MNAFCLTFIWTVLQVSIFVAIASVLYLLIRRWSSAAGSLIAAASLAVVIVISGLAFSPWPRWESQVEDESRSTTIATPDHGAAPKSAATQGELNSAASSGESLSKIIADLRATLASEFRSTSNPEATAGWRWTEIVGLMVLLGYGFGFVRLLAGLAMIQACRMRSRPVTDQSLLQLTATICKDLGCTRHLILLETSRISTPATIGWLRPVILLPANWRSWTEQETRAVLAHEIAHIRRSDFLASIVAQLGLLLHFYHPLVHWLANRLRLEQEWAADSAAAPLAGGRMSYLQILAAMAIRQADEPLSWPARAFLPTRGHLLRRVEMLKHSKRLSPQLSAVPRAMLVAVLLAVGIGIVGIGQPELPIARADEKEEKKDEPKPKFVSKQHVQNMKYIALALHNYHDVHGHFPPAMVLGPDGKTVHSWRVAILPFMDEKPLYDQYRLDEPWDSTDNKKLIKQMPEIFKNPNCDLKDYDTNFFAVTGEGMVFSDVPQKQGIKLTGLSEAQLDKTIMAVEVAEKQAVPWTKPVDFKFDPKQPRKGLGGVEENGFRASLLNGAVLLVSDNEEEVDSDGLRALMSLKDKEKLPKYFK